MERRERENRLARWEHTTFRRSVEKLGHHDAEPPVLHTPLDTQDHDYWDDIGLPGEYPFAAWTYATRTPLEEGATSLRRAGRYSGYGSPEDSRDYYADMRARGLRLGGPNIASDLPSQLGWDSDSEEAQGEVGRVGVAVDSLRDFETLYDPFRDHDDLSRISTNWTINAPAAVYLAFYCALADKRGTPRDQLRCTPQNDILKEYIARGLYIFPVTPSMRLIGDTIEWVARQMPRSNAISICAEHIRYAGGTTEQSIAFAFANAEAYVELGMERSMAVDDFVPRFTFRGFGDSTLNLFRGIAAPRASRRIWARIMRERFGALQDRTCLLRGGEHAWGNAYLRMTTQRPVNNIVRETVEAIIQGCASGQVTGSFPFDEPLGLGHSIEAQQVRRDLERILHHEAGLSDHIDPFAGSYLIESLTDEIEAQILQELQTVRDMGGAAAAVDSGYYRDCIGDSAWRTQQRLESGEDVWVGVNGYTGPDEIEVDVSRSSEYDASRIESAEERQIASLAALRRDRGSARVTATLTELERVARDPATNIMPALIDCAHAYATIGEICGILRAEFGEHDR